MNIKRPKELKKILQIFIFVTMTCLPFISLTNMIGIETFLDSFDNPDSYIFIKNSNDIQGLKTQDEQYIIIQKITHPDFEIGKNDEILYFNIKGEIECNKILDVQGTGFFTKYYLENEDNLENTLYQTQIVGKVIKNLDNNIWNELSLKLWDVSINYLNIQKIV